MCGIGGMAGPGAADQAVLDRMAAAMAHRGPDAQGTWSDEACGLAFRRLSIIDLADRSNQPLHLGRHHLVFNGEVYNYLELRAELEGLGHRFTTEGDGEVLLHAWAQWGEGALDRLNAMFAFAVWDDAERTLTLAADPFGEKPLYWRERGGRLSFASDVRALLEADPSIRPAHGDAMAAYLALGTLPEPGSTFFAGVHRLPAAHVLRWRDGRTEVRRYWTPEPVDVPRDHADAVAHLRGLLVDSIRLRLRSDVPVGTSLSGGVDSSSIVALSAELAGDHRRHAFTARFPGFARDEWRYAALVAEAAGVVEHHPIEPTPQELLADVEDLVRDQEEPVLGLSVYAQWRVMRAVREQGVTVLLDGQGADELFGGYGGLTTLAARSAGPAATLRALREDPPGAGRALLVDRAPPALHRWARRRLAAPYVSDAVAREAAAVEPPGARWRRAPGTPLRRELLRQTFASSLPALLRYADRDSMAHGREVRLPFLDRRIAEFALSLPSTSLFRDGRSKAVLRDAVRGTVPDVILDRRDKVGFEPPQAVWLADPDVRRWAAEVLLDRDARTVGLLDRPALEADARAGRWRDAAALWRALNAELWLRAFDRAGAPARALAG